MSKITCNTCIFSYYFIFYSKKDIKRGYVPYNLYKLRELLNYSAKFEAGAGSGAGPK